jgi:hypothetical protein
METTMKSIMRKITLGLALVLAAGVFHASSQSASGAESDLEQQFPQIIQYELGASGFSAGDQINITSVRGDRKHIEPGGSYLVEGTYILASADRADLTLYCTTRGPSGPTPDQKNQYIEITRGAGKFHLYETNVADGWLHVSFYPPRDNDGSGKVRDNSSLRGGVYFGEKGRESTLMRNQKWFREFAPKLTDKPHDVEVGAANEANRALLAYLGNPIPPPADMDSRYNKENLRKVFSTVCQKADLVITKLAVDDSEFPFLVYGTLAGSHPLPKAPVFEEQKGYTRGGAVRGSFGGGSSYFAVNMVPDSQYPADQEQACHRRLMLRLQMLADKAQQMQ